MSKSATMKVVATRTGYRELRRFKEGAQLTLTSPEEFSAAWMEPVGDVPEAFKAEVDRKVAEFKMRKSPEELRREAVEKKAKADATIHAQAIAQAVGTAVGQATAQALELMRAEHAKLMAAAAGPKPPQK
jgi:hypothetical protein